MVYDHNVQCYNKFTISYNNILRRTTCTINSLLSFRKGCNTNGGSHPDVPCVFPFIYKGTTYTECTDVDNSGVPWCATTTVCVNAPYFGCLPTYVPTYTGNCEKGCPGV